MTFDIVLVLFSFFIFIVTERIEDLQCGTKALAFFKHSNTLPMEFKDLKLGKVTGIALGVKGSGKFRVRYRS